MVRVGLNYSATGAGGANVASKALSARLWCLAEGGCGILHLFTAVLAGLRCYGEDLSVICGNIGANGAEGTEI